MGLRFCGRCGAQGGANGCGFRPTASGNDTRVECRECEAAAKRRARAVEDRVVPRYHDEDRTCYAPVERVEESGVKTYVVLNDIHVPYQDHRAIEIVCDVMEDLQPHGIVLNGDILDLPEVSRHNSGSVAHLEGKRIAQTFTAGNKLLDQLEASLGPRCTIRHWINGNHCGRWYRYLQSGDNVVFADDDHTDIATRLQLARRGYVYHRDYPEAHVFLGKLLVCHGQFTGKYPAARHMERFQVSTLVGHTHTVQIYHASTWDGQRVAYCNGYLADPDSEAMAYAPRPRAWQQGFAVVYVAEDGRFWVQLLSIVGGELHYGGRQYPKKLRRAA